MAGRLAGRTAGATGPVVALAEFELWIASSTSLKDRRRVVRSVVDRLRARLNCAVAELEQPTGWQRARVAVACVASSAGQAREMLMAVRRLVEQNPDAEVTSFEVSFYP